MNDHPMFAHRLLGVLRLRLLPHVYPTSAQAQWIEGPHSTSICKPNACVELTEPKVSQEWSPFGKLQGKALKGRIFPLNFIEIPLKQPQDTLQSSLKHP